MLKKILGLGKWIFIIPFAVFGITHLLNAREMTGMVPAFISGGTFWVILTGVGQLAFALSVILGKYDKLAAVLCALMLLIFILTLHLPGLSDLQMSTLARNNMLKDLGLIGGALMYASHFSKDKRVIGD